MPAKMAFLKQIYPSEKEGTFKTSLYKSFFEKNKPWLIPYAAFSCLRDKHGTVDFTQWPEFRNYDEEKIAALTKEGSVAYDEVAFYFFLQFHLHRQLREATEYAHTKGVVLKGDIPIGVARFGIDAWQQPDLYHMDMQAGAPPDAFSAKGQNWSFPTYNWPRMQRNGFAWWKQRFAQMADYFDAFRIDHILGFFRIWSIPTHAVEGILGYFVEAIPVRPEELASRGINLEPDRLLKPYITDALLSQVFGHDAEFSGADKLVAIYAFAFQIFGDFAGYTDIARGVGKLMGFELVLNFNLPYLAVNVSDLDRERWILMP